MIKKYEVLQSTMVAPDDIRKCPCCASTARVVDTVTQTKWFGKFVRNRYKTVHIECSECQLQTLHFIDDGVRCDHWNRI